MVTCESLSMDVSRSRPCHDKCGWIHVLVSVVAESSVVVRLSVIQFDGMTATV